jgi:hypothetical protein
MNFLSYYDTYLIFIIGIKILFLISALGLFYYSHFSNSSSSLAKSLQFELWKERTEFIFILSMTILLLYLFYPRKTPITINRETNLLLFIYGCILIVELIKKAYGA